MYGQALMVGTQMTVERPQADKIIKAAIFVVLRARYESGRVTEKYLSTDIAKRFITLALLAM